MSRQTQLHEAFASLTEELVGDYDLADLLHRLAEYCVSLCAAGGAGIVIVDEHGILRDIAYSSENVRRLETFQLTSGQGPCVECVHLGRPVVEPDLNTAGDRWPEFAREARRLGFDSVRALPLRLHGLTVGALNLFDVGRTGTDEADLRSAQTFANLAVIAVLQHRALEPQTVAEHITRALTARSTIERAKGILAETAGVDMDAAFDLLREHARRRVLGLTETARRLADGELTAEAVLAG